MSVELLAEIYVDYLIPGFKILLLLIAVMLVLYIWNLVKEPGKTLEMAAQFFQSLFGGSIKLVQYIFIGIWETCRFFVRVLHIIFATLRDFFMSRI